MFLISESRCHLDHAGAHSEHSQIFKMELFTKIVSRYDQILIFSTSEHINSPRHPLISHRKKTQL